MHHNLSQLAAPPKPSRILYLIGQLGPGGAERQLVFLLQALDRERYRPAVAVWNYRETEPYVSQVAALGVPLFPLPPVSSFAKLIVLRRYIRLVRPEVVHSYSFFTNIAAWVGALGSGAVAIGAVRGDYFQDVRSSGWLRATVNSRWPRCQIVNSVSALQNARTTLMPFRPRLVRVVRNALDLERFGRLPNQELRGTPHIIGVGSLLRIKRWDRLLKAAAELKKRGLNFQVDIAGDGPMRNSLESLARELDIVDRVSFLGYVSHIENRLKTASLLAHTSDTEGCPNAVIEAMASGLPVVATDSGDVPGLVDHGRTGFIIKRGDDASLVNCLETLLANEALRQEMGRAGRLKAEQEFRIDRLASQTLAVYKSAGWQDALC